MNKKPIILLTNDDGIRSPGLIAAAGQLAGLGETWVVAPHIQQTSAGRSFPPQSTGTIKITDNFPVGIKAYSVEASPAQCVNYAILHIMPKKPDLIVSGINSGVNVGIDITRSGTIGAALEAACAGIRAIAVSLEIHQDEVFAEEPAADFSTAAYFTRLFSEAVLTKTLESDTAVLKIDVPSSAVQSTPWEVCRLSPGAYYKVCAPLESGGTGPGQLEWVIEEDHSTFIKGTDTHTVFIKKKIAVTPLSLDLTSRVSLSSLEKSLKTGIPQ